MTVAEYSKKMHQTIIDDIASGEVKEIYGLQIGMADLDFFRIDTPLEVKRFLHIFKQCDLSNLKQTCDLLDRAGFIKNIGFGYAPIFTPFQNLTCFFAIQKIKFLNHCRSIVR